MTNRSSLVRRATMQDVDAILQLEKATDQAPHWPRQGYLEIIEAGEPAAGETSGRVRCLFVAVSGGGEPDSQDLPPIFGFAAAALVLAECNQAASPAELESIAVSASARRQGTGRALCRAVMQWASMHGADSLDLEVRARNTAAAQLYRSLGFEETGRRPRYYSDPEEDALLMSLRLQKEDSGQI